MRKDYTEIIAAVEAEATALQAEIDAAIDEHGVLRRFVDELTGKGGGPAWIAPLAVPKVAIKRDRNGDFVSIVEEEAIPPVKAAPMRRPKGAAPRVRVNGTVNWPAVAKWINEHKASGTYSVVALADAFGKPKSTVKNWYGDCQRRGLLVETTTQADAVAPAPDARLNVGGPVIGTGNKPMTAARPHVLACQECPYECATTEAHLLNRHCLDKHNRRPSSEERMPVLAGAA